MAVSSSAVTVTNSATALNAASDSDSRAGFSVLVYNNGSSTVYIGGPSVTSTTGVKQLAAAVTVGPGVVWFAAVGLGSPATQPTVRVANSPVGLPIGAIGGSATTLASQNALAGVRLDSQTSLPTTIPVSSLVAVNSPARLIFQAA